MERPRSPFCHVLKYVTLTLSNYRFIPEHYFFPGFIIFTCLDSCVCWESWLTVCNITPHQNLRIDLFRLCSLSVYIWSQTAIKLTDTTKYKFLQCQQNLGQRCQDPRAHLILPTLMREKSSILITWILHTTHRYW